MVNESLVSCCLFLVQGGFIENCGAGAMAGHIAHLLSFKGLTQQLSSVATTRSDVFCRVQHTCPKSVIYYSSCDYFYAPDSQ
jgi:hypothetical protein